MDIRFEPKLRLWAINRKFVATHESFVPGSCAESCHNEEPYKHLALATYTGMFPEANYINTIGSKPVVKPLGASTELSITMNMFLQRAMVRHKEQLRHHLTFLETYNQIRDQEQN